VTQGNKNKKIKIIWTYKKKDIMVWRRSFWKVECREDEDEEHQEDRTILRRF
jgi:hypothetical protein